jgi:hypothetical protein
MNASASPADLDRLAKRGRTTVKADRDVTVEVLGDGDEAVVCKTYHNTGTRLLQTLWRTSRARREFDNLRAISEAGLPCTEPVAWSERRRLGCVEESMLATRLLRDSQPLKHVLADLPAASRFAARRRLIQAAAGLVAALHRHGVLWGTAMPRNVLVVGDADRAELAVCDVPAGIRTGRSLHGSRLAMIDLFDGAFSPSRRADFSRAERLRWLLAYCGGDREAARSLWRRLDRRSVWRHDLASALAILWHVHIVLPLRRRFGRRPDTQR